MPSATAALSPPRPTERAPAPQVGAGPRRRLRRYGVPAVATLAVVPLYAVWARYLATGGGDLAAQEAWAGFISRHPGSAYNLAWYGGMNTADYSLLSPYLMAWLGVRTVTVAAGIAGSWYAAALCVRAGVRRPLGPALLASLALWCDAASGRTTFALGAAFGLAACLAAAGPVRRTPSVAALSALATAASPVAGLFLVVAGAARLLAGDIREAVALIVPPVVVVAATALLFPCAGEQPMAFGRIWLPVAFSATTVLCAPKQWRALRLGAAVYAVGVVLTYAVASPIGTNVERLAELAGPAVLLACLPAPGRHRLQRLALAAALALSVNWLVHKTVDDLRVSTRVPAWAARTDGVVAELRELAADRARVEVVPARNHREAASLAPYVNMARGWNRQVDMVRGRLFYDGSFSPAGYRVWLGRRAVAYVVLGAGRPDDHAQQEAALVRSGPGWLTPVWRDAHWRIYRVRNAQPLASRPASVLRSDSASLVVRVPHRGSVTLRVAYSRWLHADGACLTPSGEWTRLTVPKPGDYRIGSSYRLPWPRC